MNAATRRVLAVVSCLAIAAVCGLRGAVAESVRIPFALPGATAAAITLEAAVYRPASGTRFPLAVVNHGDPGPSHPDERRAMHPAYDVLRTWLVDHGYAVIVPMRRGFGSSDGDVAEDSGSCHNPDYVASGLAGADDIEAALAYMRRQPFVVSNRIVLVGHSSGGFGSLAEASRRPQGGVAVVNFAGGRGQVGPGDVCSPDKLVAAMGAFGTTTRVPTLWIYSENDQYFSPAFAAGSPQAEFFAAPPYDSSGHTLVNHAGTGWESVVDAFLKKVVPGP